MNIFHLWKFQRIIIKWTEIIVMIAELKWDSFGIFLMSSFCLKQRLSGNRTKNIMLQISKHFLHFVPHISYRLEFVKLSLIQTSSFLNGMCRAHKATIVTFLALVQKPTEHDRTIKLHETYRLYRRYTLGQHSSGNIN